MSLNFNLNVAIESWRNELAAQPQLTPEDRRELEKHLADAMADLRQRGLSEVEAFWLARRRIGQPQQLAEEFTKANPSNVWRERLFWMAAGLLVANLFGNISNGISSFGYVWFSHTVQEAFMAGPVFGSVIWLVAAWVTVTWLLRRKTGGFPLPAFVRDRRKFVIAAVATILAVNLAAVGMEFVASSKFFRIHSSGGLPPFIGVNAVFSLIRELGLFVALVLLMPRQVETIRMQAK